MTPDERSNCVATVHRVAKGDQSALGKLYNETSPIIFGLVQRIVGDRSTAEEITLDVYTQAWRLAPTYSQEEGTPVTWLLMMARSRAIDYLRSPAGRIKVLERPIAAAFEFSSPGLHPEKEMISDSRRRIILKVLAELKPEQLELVQLAFFEGLSHIEISEKTGIPLGTVKSRIRAGMMRLRELLEPLAEAL
ncbi:MAG TPA: sigma-70 family RNA polymerase sigma factor [Candidatus Acidoferrum sp.]|nr:sigma-70 family RNA polymerase sigma factor [Candidatus Acidoferrum sp.]